MAAHSRFMFATVVQLILGLGKILYMLTLNPSVASLLRAVRTFTMLPQIVKYISNTDCPTNVALKRSIH